MLPQYIKVENFASYINETIKFNEFGEIFALMGENGSGKSSIIHMITTCIFFRAPGIAASGAGMDELIHEGAESFKIEFCFKMNSSEYIVIREKSKKGQSLKLFIDGQDNSGKLVETQKRINDIIKMDYETFMDTVIIGQGESASFMKKSPTERKKIIAQILRLDKYDILEDYTKDIKKDLKNKILSTEQKMNDLYDLIKDKEQFKISLNNYSEELISINSQIENKEKEYQNEIEEKTKYEQMKKQQENIIMRKNKLTYNIQNIQSEIDKYNKAEIDIKNILSKKEDTLLQINNLNSEIESYTSKLNQLTSEKIKLETENKILSKTIDDLKARFIKLKNYNECNCQFCGQNISPQYKQQHLSEIKNEGTKNQNKLSLNNSRLSELNNTINELNNKIHCIKINLREFDALKTKISQAEIKIESVQSKLIDLQERLTESLNEQNSLNEIEIIDITNKIFKDNFIKIELDNLRKKHTFNNTQIGIIQNRLEDISLNEIKYSNIKQDYNGMKEDMVVYEELQKAWSKNGIQAIIIDNILPQIEDEINKYLKILSDDKIFIKFITQKENKNGNKSETLEIIVSDSKGARSYERYSGGQKTRIDFACHIGMSKFLAKRSGANIDLFVVDEGIGTLDDAGKQNFLDTVNLLGGIFKQVMVISHIPDIIEAFDNKIIVTNDIFNGSKVNIMK